MKLKNLLLCVAVSFFAFVIVIGCGGKNSMSQSEKNEAQDSIRAMSQQTLGELFKNEPVAKSTIEKAVGYAVFSDFGFKVLFMGAAKGKGVAVDNASQKETFMKMVELQPGLGVGAEKYYLVFIFENPDAFNKFVTSGWELGANAMASAKDDKGEGGSGAGALTFRDGVKMYQLSDTGAIVGVSITAAKYYKDDELN